MKQAEEQQPSLYLEVCSLNEEPRLPLHTSIVLFLLSYCECRSFTVVLVFNNKDRITSDSESLMAQLPDSVSVTWVLLEDAPQLVRSCRLPAAVDGSGRFCRAGLAVVLRHIIIRTAEASRNEVLALLGFKKTCLKACAEVSEARN